MAILLFGAINSPIMSEEIKVDDPESKQDVMVEEPSNSQKKGKKQSFFVQHQKLVLDIDIDNKAVVGYTDIKIKCSENLSSVNFNCNSQIRKFQFH